MQQPNNFTEGPILKPLLTFTIPVLLALFLQSMYGAVDLTVVGHFGVAADVSAVSTGSQILLLGAPIALQDALVSVSFLAIIAITNSLGVIASAGVGVAEKLVG